MKNRKRERKKENQKSENLKHIYVCEFDAITTSRHQMSHDRTQPISLKHNQIKSPA